MERRKLPLSLSILIFIAQSPTRNGMEARIESQGATVFMQAKQQITSVVLSLACTLAQASHALLPHPCQTGGNWRRSNHEHVFQHWSRGPAAQDWCRSWLQMPFFAESECSTEVRCWCIGFNPSRSLPQQLESELGTSKWMAKLSPSLYT